MDQGVKRDLIEALLVNEASCQFCLHGKTDRYTPCLLRRDKKLRCVCEDFLWIHHKPLEAVK